MIISLYDTFKSFNKLKDQNTTVPWLRKSVAACHSRGLGSVPGQYVCKFCNGYVECDAILWEEAMWLGGVGEGR